MSIIISKELLSAVLEFQIKKLDFHRMSADKKEVEFGFILENEENIQNVFHMNIHELAHKSKKWAIKIDIKDSINNYILVSFIRSNGLYSEVLLCEQHPTCYVDTKCPVEEFCADTEPEAIFKACQWILDNKDKGVR